MKGLLLSMLVLVSSMLLGQGSAFNITGTVTSAETGESLVGAVVFVKNTTKGTTTNPEGRYTIENLTSGSYDLEISYLGKTSLNQSIQIIDKDLVLNLELMDSKEVLSEITIIDNDESQAIDRLRSVENAAIYASKKTEVVVLDKLTINKASNISRQIYARVAGLNIWESDGAGIQLGIGGRGLSPNRNSNFNTRQSGYDISADALGYPESYYTPPADAISRIEVIRGAASLQYGTQFGGMLNFRFNEGPKDKKIEFQSKLTRGSFDFLSSFNSIGGTVGKVNYYGFYQYKKAGGWRPNSSISQHNGFISAELAVSDKLQIKGEYTHSNYLAQQPGGLTDTEFETNPRSSKRERNWFAVDWNLFAVELNYQLLDNLKFNSKTFGLIAGRDALGNLDNINLLDFGENRDFLSDDFNNWGNESRFLYRYTTNEQPSTLLVGWRYYNGRTLRKQGEGSDGSDADFRYLNPDNLEGSDFELPSTNISLFAENVFTLSEKWSVTPGVRYENISTATDGYYREIFKDLAGNIISDERINEVKENNRSFVFFGLGASYKPSTNVEFYSNVSQNYRAINFNDIRVNVGSLIVDENLTDERGFTFDIGARGNLNKSISFDYSMYHISYNDRIGTILKTEPNPNFNGLVDRVIRFRSNIADASIVGIESLIDIDLLSLIDKSSENTKLNLFTNFSWTQATYSSEDNAVDGNDVELVPNITFKTGLNFSQGSFESSLLFGYTAAHFSDASNAVRTPTAIEGLIPAYQVMDLSLGYSWKRFKIDAGVNNLLDERYFTRRATGYPGPGIIPSDGRSGYLTLGITL